MRIHRAVRVLVCWLGVLLVAAGAPPKKPKLVLAIVVDQFRYDYLQRFRGDYHAGFDRLLTHGAVFTNAHLVHAATVTAVGHSTFLSGAAPSSSGIIANEWFDRETGKRVTSVSDPQSSLVGGTSAAQGSSPRRLLVSTVGDELKIKNADSKVIGISIKDRAAILPAGHMADAAYWYDGDSSHWVTSTYYRAELPDWVRKINSQNNYQRYIGVQWLPFDAKDNSAKPFCTMVAGTDVRYCGGLEYTPWGNDLVEEFAEAAIENENLGGHSSTDVLTVSFSANDYVGHRVGPDDPAVRDIAIRTDRVLGKLFDFVQKRVGMDQTLVVLTADHGVAPVPEVNQARHMPGGRISETRVINRMTEALVKRYGPGEWILPGAEGSVGMTYLNLDLVSKRNLDPAVVEQLAANAALAEPHIARVYTRHDLESGRVQQDAIGRAMSLGYYGPRSADVFILQEPYYLFDFTGTTHGTPYGYDSHVPVIFLGSEIKSGIYRGSIAPNDIAPTLASLLEVEPPSGSIGRVLAEMIE